MELELYSLNLRNFDLEFGIEKESKAQGGWIRVFALSWVEICGLLYPSSTVNLTRTRLLLFEIFFNISV